MDLKIRGKIALITGADSGIGFNTAFLLAQEGASIIISDLDTDKLIASKERLISLLGQEHPITAIAADVRNNDSVIALEKQVEEQYGRLDILVHCAGARGAADGFLNLTDDDWIKTIQVDLMGAVRICRAFIPQIIKHNWGRLVLVSSENAFQPYVDESPYNACKAAIVNLSKCLSRAYSKEGVTINCISPAFIETPMTDAVMQEIAEKEDISIDEAVKKFAEEKRPHIAMKRRGKTEEVASTIVYLCSNKASFINGSNYRIDGGSVASAFG